MRLSDVAGAMAETERRVPGPTPSGGMYGIVRYLDASGNHTNEADAVSIEFSEYAEDDRLISVTTATLGAEREHE
jgi:hypothetical protein